MRTLWVANVAGGPFQYTPTRWARPTRLENVHEGFDLADGIDAVAGF
jgi:hypothetical protein